MPILTFSRTTLLATSASTSASTQPTSSHLPSTLTTARQHAKTALETASGHPFYYLRSLEPSNVRTVYTLGVWESEAAHHEFLASDANARILAELKGEIDLATGMFEYFDVRVLSQSQAGHCGEGDLGARIRGLLSTVTPDQAVVLMRTKSFAGSVGMLEGRLEGVERSPRIVGWRIPDGGSGAVEETEGFILCIRTSRRGLNYEMPIDVGLVAYDEMALLEL